MKQSNALIIFAKMPAPGRVKTRLSPPLTPDTAARLYCCMLADTIALARRLPGVGLSLHYQDDPGAGDYFGALAPGLEARPQDGADLGERMANAFRDRFAAGHDRVAIIGSDSPDLPGDYILRGFDLLEGGTDVVFGPSEDGGYYLLAMGQFRSELFSDLPWSSPQLLQASLERAATAGIGTALLPPWYDLDTWDDLRRARAGGGIPAAPLTDDFLRTELASTGLTDSPGRLPTS
jgi:rSAM/selenodomain-associated transferase 1